MRYAVGYGNFFDNNLIVVIVEEKDPRGAVLLAVQELGSSWPELEEDLPHTEKEIKQYFFDCDSMIGWVEV